MCMYFSNRHSLFHLFNDTKVCYFLFTGFFFNIKGESLVVVLFSMPTWIRKVKFFCFLGFFFLADKRSKEKLMLIRFINCSYENEINVCYVYISIQGRRKPSLIYIRQLTLCTLWYRLLRKTSMSAAQDIYKVHPVVSRTAVI